MAGIVVQKETVLALPRAERIRRRREFLQVQRCGVRTGGRHMMLIGLPNELTRSRLGILAPKRLGGAVWRNRSKRRVRELFRHHKPVLGLDLVVLPRRDFLDVSFDSLADDYRHTLHRHVRIHRPL